MSNFTDNFPKLIDLGAAEWIEAMLKLDTSHLTPDQLMQVELELARVGSMAAVKEAK